MSPLAKVIEVGDLVRVVSVCCGKHAYLLGRIGVVAEKYIDRYTRSCCGYRHEGLEFRVPDAGSNPRNIMRGWFAKHELQRIPPLNELEDAKRNEEITA